MELKFEKMNKELENSVFIKTLQGKATDRPPVWFMRQAGRVLPSYMKMREKYSFRELMEDPVLAAEVTLLPIYDLGVDAAILFSDILVIPEAMGMKLQWTDHGPRFTNPLKDSSDPVSELVADPSRLDHIYAAIDEIIKTRPADIPLIGFCGAPFTTLCYMVQGLGSSHTFPAAIEFLYRNKKTTLKLIDAITELSIEYALTQVKHGISAFQLFETHAGLIPSDVYFEMIMPAVRKISNAVRETGTPVIFLPKGLGAGIQHVTFEDADFISIDWQTSLFEARKLVDPRVGIQGNLDPRLLLADKNTIIETLEKYTPFAKEESKWIFNLGHGLIPEISFENTKLAVDWIKQNDWKRS